jgi:hypothetical protein
MFGVEVKGLVLILGSLHLSMMAVLGVWLWKNTLSFGTDKTANLCGIDHSSTVILGARVPLAAKGLRIFSIVFYAIFLIPGGNLLTPILLFLSLFRLHRLWYCVFKRHSLEPNFPPASLPASRWRRLYNALKHPTGVGMLILLAINLVFLVDIELTLRRNRDLVSSGESLWTFGQILAMLLLVLPIRDLKVFKDRRDNSSALEAAIRGGADKEILWELVNMGADINLKAAGQSPLCCVCTACVLKTRCQRAIIGPSWS